MTFAPHKNGGQISKLNFYRPLLFLWMLTLSDGFLAPDKKHAILTPLSLHRFEKSRMEKDGDFWVRRTVFISKGPFMDLQKQRLDFFLFVDQILRTIYFQPLAADPSKYYKAIDGGLSYLYRRYVYNSYLLPDWTDALEFCADHPSMATQMPINLLLSVYEDELIELDSIYVS